MKILFLIMVIAPGTHNTVHAAKFKREEQVNKKNSHARKRRDSQHSLVHLSNDTGLHNISHRDEDVIGGVTIQRSTETLLVEMVTDEANAASEDEKTVESANADVFVCFILAKSAAVSQEIDKANGNAAIDVEDEGILLGGGDLLDGNSIVEQRVAGEVLANVVLDELDTQVGVVDALNFVADTADYGNHQQSSVTPRRVLVRTKLVGFARLVDKLARGQSGVTGVGEHSSSLIKSTTKPATNGE